MQEDSNARVTNFEMFDTPVTSVWEEYADVAGLLTAKDSGVRTGSVSTQRDWLPRCAGSGERQLLIPGGATSEEDLISGGEEAALIDRRKGTPGLRLCVRTGVVAIRSWLVVDEECGSACIGTVAGAFRFVRLRRNAEGNQSEQGRYETEGPSVIHVIKVPTLADRG